MAPLRLLLIIVLAVILTGFIFFLRAFFASVLDQLYRALGYPGFSWDLVPEPIRSALRFLDEKVLPNAFLILLVGALVVELISWWQYTKEGVVLYGG
ncbi:MAG: hypothetical protein QXT28_09970 [Thermofilaceae archaeon]